MTLRRVVLASRPTRVRILSCEAGTAPAEEISWAATCAKVGLALTVIPVLVGLGLNAAQRAFGSDFMPWEGLLLPLFLFVLPIVGIILLIQSAALAIDERITRGATGTLCASASFWDLFSSEVWSTCRC